MIRHYLILSFKRIFKQWKTSMINILGLGFGIASILIISIWIAGELNYEKCFKNGERISQAYLKSIQGDNVGYQATTAPLIASMLKSDYPEIEETARISRLGEVVVKIDDSQFLEDLGGAADHSYFNIFNYDFISGSPESVFKDPYSVVLTESQARKYFGDEIALNQKLIINSDYEFTVSAVIKDLPNNAYRKFDFVVPFEFIRELGYDINGSVFFPCQYITYALLKDNTDFDQLQKKVEDDISAEIEGQISFSISLQPLRNTYIIESGSKTKIPIFASLALLILVLACTNYANLTLGQVHNQTKGYAIWQMHGAKKINIFSQHLLESFLITIVASVLAVGFVYLFLDQFNVITGLQLTFDLGNVYTLSMLITLVLLTGVFAGLYPSLVIASAKPINSINKVLNSRKRNHPIRTSLIVFQFVISTSFIIFTIVLFLQNRYVRTFNYGFSKEDILYVGIEGEIKDRLDEVKDELLRDPYIVSVSATSNLPNGILSGSYFEWGIEDVSPKRICESYTDENYLQTFGLSMVKGRFFDPDIPSDRLNSVVINESAASLLNEDDPVGKTMQYRGYDVTIIGIIKDFQNNSPLNSRSEPIIFGYRTNQSNYLSVRIDPLINNSDQYNAVINNIKETCDRFSPERPIYLSQLKDFSYGSEEFLLMTGKLIQFGSVLALLISCFGLFGIVYQSLSTKIKEVGIRKVNGGKPLEIIKMLVVKYLKWIILALVIACPLSYIGMNEMLKSFSNHININGLIFLGAGLFVTSFAVVIIVWQTMLVVNRNPVEALRYE